MHACSAVLARTFYESAEVGCAGDKCQVLCSVHVNMVHVLVLTGSYHLYLAPGFILVQYMYRSMYC